MAPSHGDPDGPEETWVAVADLHGHLAHFNALLAHLDRTLGDSYRLCTLGDYVDNGPAVPAHLDRLIDLSRTRGDRFAPIVGNHDLALLRTLGWPHVEPDACWWTQWRSNYWNPGLGTPAAYGASSFGEFVTRFPEPHHALLRSLPRCHDTGRYLFVHAGAMRGPLAPQREDLAQRVLPLEPLFLPPMIRDRCSRGVGSHRGERSHRRRQARRPTLRERESSVSRPTSTREAPCTRWCSRRARGSRWMRTCA